jgi:uncharacterized protein (DUF934 family)
MPLLKGDAVVADDRLRVADDAPVPAAGPLLLTRQRLEAEAEHLWHRPDGLGVELMPGDAVEAIEDWLPRLDLVAFRFPSFTDGRPFSAARILRERYRFTGEIRAVGHVIPDQAQFLLQCGFDSIEIDEDALPRWRAAKAWMPLTYQIGYTETLGPNALAVFRARHGRPETAAA